MFFGFPEKLIEPSYQRYRRWYRLSTSSHHHLDTDKRPPCTHLALTPQPQDVYTVGVHLSEGEGDMCRRWASIYVRVRVRTTCVHDGRPSTWGWGFNGYWAAWGWGFNGYWSAWGWGRYVYTLGVHLTMEGLQVIKSFRAHVFPNSKGPID
jgi:hypothetical protein